MRNIILNRLKPQAAKIIAEEQAGFRAGRSTTQQIFNLRTLCKKHLQHQQDLYHVFIDFKEAVDRAWHAALWPTMKMYISANFITSSKNLYDKAISAVLFNIFLKGIMTDAIEDHEDTRSTEGRTITNLRFADDIDDSVRGK